MKKNQNITWFILVCLTLMMVLGLCFMEYGHHYYNNYLIFSRPLRVMLEGGNIYDFHPEYYMDTYKYSPSFAIVAGLLSYMPDLAGIITWNLLNTACLIIGLRYFFTDPVHRMLSLVLLLPMIAISVHNEQSNPLMTGCLLLFIYFLRNGKSLPAAAFITICLFIKVYAFLMVIMFLFFPQKRVFVLYTLVCIILGLIFPLLIVNAAYLADLYKLWWHVLKTTELTIQCSVMGIAGSWFGIKLPYIVWVIAGLVILLFPLSNKNFFNDARFREMMVSSLLIFMVLFNKMAGFPTYLIAVSGSCIWFFALENKNLISKSIVLFIFVLGICSQYVWPHPLVDQWIIPTNIWAFLLLINWIYIQIALWKMEFNNINNDSHE